MTETKIPGEYDHCKAFWAWKEANKAQGEAVRKLVRIHIWDSTKLTWPEELKDPRCPKDLRDVLLRYLNTLLVEMDTTGVSKGAPDYFSPTARGKYHGLYIKMKTPRGMLSRSQNRWKRWVEDEGYAYVMALGWQKAVEAVLWYEGLGTFEQAKDE